MGLDLTLTAALSGNFTTALDLTDVKVPINIANNVQLTDGTASGQANQFWSDQRTLAASATENIDLAGSLINAFGTTLTFTKIKGIYIKAAVGNTNNVQLTRPASNGLPLFLAAGDGLNILPGGMFLWACYDNTAVPVTAGTGDLLTLTNSGGGTSVTYDIVIVGVV